MKLEFTNLQNKINSKDLVAKSANFLNRREKAILIALFLAALAYCVYLWYAYAYDFSWESAKRQQYIASQNDQTNLNEGKLNGVLGNIDARQKEFGQDINGPADFFRLK